MIEDKAVDDESFSRCGWFDSSLELAAGLQDRVHRPAA